MAVKFIPTRIGSGLGYATQINQLFSDVQSALQDAVSRTGNGPNAMSADLDLGTNDLLNVGRANLQELYVEGTPLASLTEMQNLAAESENWANLSYNTLVPEGDGVDDYSAKHFATVSSNWAEYGIGSPVPEGNGSEYSARHWADKSNKWAETAEDAEVEPGEYSAFHWAQKSKNNSNGIASVDTLSGLKAVDTAAFTTIILSGTVREGVFHFDNSDLSTEVANDEVTTGEGDGGIYVAPDSDKTGASGAWVRQYSGRINIKWYGAKGDGVTDDTAAIQAALNTQGSNTADGRSGTAVYAPEPDVAYIFSSIAHKTVGIVGDGYDDRFRGPRNDPKYQDDSYFGGTVFRSTAASGIAMDFGKPKDLSEGPSKPPLKGFIVIGDTNNGATGICLGARLGGDVQEVRLANFDTGVQFNFFEDCWFLGLRTSGCGIGLNIDLGDRGNNQNTFYMTECNQCDTSIRIIDGMSNIFYGLLLQGSDLTDGVVLGAGSAYNGFYDTWAEAAWSGDVIKTEGDNCRENIFRNWKFNADTSAITLGGGSGSTGDHVLEGFNLPGGNAMSLTVNVDRCVLKRISENIAVTDNGAGNSLTREGGVTGDWTHRFDYERGQVRNSVSRAPLQFMAVDNTSALQYVMRFKDNDGNEVGAVNLRSANSFEIEDGDSNRVHIFEFGGDATHSGSITGGGFLGIEDGIATPTTKAGTAQLYVDSSDGDLKVKFGDGTIKSIVSDA